MLYALPSEYDAGVRDVALAFVRRLLEAPLGKMPASLPDIRGRRRFPTAELVWFDMHDTIRSVAVDDGGDECDSDPSPLSITDLLGVLLAHTQDARRWRQRAFDACKETPQDGSSWDASEIDATVACIVELLICMGYVPDSDVTHGDDGSGAAGVHAGLLHLLASGGCDPDVWNDVPHPLSAPLQKRLLAVCVLAGANVELLDVTHGATALGWACWFGCLDGARALLSLGANKAALDDYGSTPHENMLARHGVALDELHTEPGAASPGADPEDDSDDEATVGGAYWRPPTAAGRARQQAHLDAIREHLQKLRALHAGWAEAKARAASAWRACIVSRACAQLTESHSSLPGPALQAVADALMTFDCWSPPMTRPAVVEL